MAEYPATRRDGTVDDYHGKPVADPYRWLEAMDSAETLAWVDAQNEVTFAHLDTLPERGRIRSRLEELWDFPRESPPMRRGAWYFYTRNDGLQPQPILYKRAVKGGDPIVVLDPNTMSDDGTIALMTLSFTKDGSLLAYTVAEAGSDWQVVRVLDIESGERLPDELHQVKFTTLAWAPGDGGFYYARLPEADGSRGAQPPGNERVYLHRLRDEQSSDELVYARPDAPDLGFQPFVTHDDELLVLHVWQGTDTRNRLYYRRADDAAGEFIRLLDDFDAKYRLVGHVAGRLYVLTDHSAPRGRVIAIPLDRPGSEYWQELIAEGEETLEFAALAGGYIVTGSLRDASHVVSVHELDGKRLAELDLPALGTVTEFAGKPDQSEFFIGFESFAHAPTVLRYDLETRELRPVAPTPTPAGSDGFVTTRTWATSPDGTLIPVFVTHRTDLELDGTNPTILYGYGGFDIPLTPTYAPGRTWFIEAGGVFATANLRGGGEYGREWHEAGMFGNKQNVFDDFIAAAEHLIAAGYTSAEHLGILGGSNGGLLVTACLLQRPDLFGAAVAMVPVTDMLRYHRFTAGRYWTAEWGKADDGPDVFEYLRAYSPLHNVAPAHYPPTMVTTGDTDDRVVPLHAYKFVAALQPAAADSGPVLLRVDRRAGHGLGKPTSMRIDEVADIFSFFDHHLS
jgi:prolyl oligopeptidase